MESKNFENQNGSMHDKVSVIEKLTESFIDIKVSATGVVKDKFGNIKWDNPTKDNLKEDK